MINADEVILNQRLANAVDVPGVLDNCFFHSYAAYVLANKLPLPTDLFTPSAEKAGSPAERLKETFKSPADLEIFNTYQQQRFPGTEDSKMIAEKSLVLGVLYREWFAEQLLKNEAHKDELFDNDNESKVSFIKLINACRDVGVETALRDDRMAPIYEANPDFFNNLHRTPQLDEKQAFRTYWDEQGYKNYCQHLATPNVRISFTDVDPVLKSQNVPYTLYSKQDGSITSQNAGNAEQPRFELVISETEEHYTLLKDNQTEGPLNEYAASLAQYKVDREAILLMDGTQAEKRDASRNMPSQLVGATCPRGAIANNQIEALIAAVTEIKSKVSQLEAEDRQDITATMQDTPLTAKEQQVLQATTEHNLHTDPSKVQSYKEEVKKLIVEGRKGDFSNDSQNVISTQDAKDAEGLEGETDEDFAKRLQDTEFRGAGLK